MMIARRLASASLAALCACGGGGGGSGSSGSSEDKSWLTFSPTLIEATSYAGEELQIDVTARSSKTIAERLNLAVVSAAPVIRTAMEITAFSATEYRAKLSLSTDLAPGTYTGSFEVRLCRDDPVTCASPYPGSPWQVPYRFTVRPTTDLRALVPLPGATGWSGFLGDAAHNGFVSAEVNPVNFTMRFKWADKEPRSLLETAATDGGSLFVASMLPQKRIGESDVVVSAIDESNGQVKWQTDIMAGPVTLTAANGRLYMTSNQRILALDARSGQQLWNVPSGYRAPIIHRGKMYAAVNGGVSRYDAASGKLEWTSTLSSAASDWLVSADDGGVFSYDGNELCVLRADDGTVLNRVRDPGPLVAKRSPPVLDGRGGIFVATYGVSQSALDWPFGRLSRFEAGRSSPTWTVSSERFSSPPVLADGVLYINNGPRLEARSPATGALLWSWTGPASVWDVESLIVVGKHAFVGRGRTTFAVDLTTHQPTWMYAASGTLTVSSNGILAIHDRQVVTFNLR